uniref:Tox-SGS domain-containing protein n=1 Tax=Anopheles farauti TaxID=69004 RepID=A0A182Q560_9DIPT
MKHQARAVMGSRENPEQYQKLLDVAFGDETNLFHAKVSHQEVLLVKHQRSLHCFRLESSAPSGVVWKVLWSRNEFFDEKEREFGSSFFVAKTGWVLVRKREGLQFYRMEGSDLALRHYCSDGRYHEMYGWNAPGTVFLMGHMYADSAVIGVITRNKRGAIRFEQMAESVVLKGGSQPLWKLHDLPNLPNTWRMNSTSLSLAYVDRTQQSAIVERTSSEISVYKLEANYHPQLVGRAKSATFSSANNERILFGNILTANDYWDMLLLNASGLMLYKRVGTSYQPVWHSSKQISGGLGLEKKHWTTAGLIDVDRDGKDELWFTGPRGIVGCKVTETNAESIPFGLAFDDDVRYARIMAVLPDGVNARAVAVGGRKLFAFMLTTSDESAKGNNDQSTKGQGNEANIEPIFALDTQSGPLVEASLAEQLDTSMLYDPINPMNGQLEFAIPLLEVGKMFHLPTTKFIAYRESASTPGTMGIGWSLQADFVYVDRRKSIFPENHRYYLVKDGSASLLSLKTMANDVGATEQISTFSIEGNNQTSITFNRTRHQWKIVGDNGESFYYGTHGDKTVVKMDAGSEDWPFPIANKAANTQLASVWYLIRRSDRAEQWIEYSYTKVANTNDYQLAAITTSNEASLTLSYSVQFEKTLFTGFTLRTRRYVQSAALHYTMQDEKVRLKRISQQNKTVLEFGYDGPDNAMSEIIYPNGLIAKFDYILLQIGSNVLMNRFETYSHPKTAYGPTYLLIADITDNGQVRIRIRDALGSDTVPLAGASIPLLGKLPVASYEMFTGESYFSVLLQHTGSHSELCLFEAHADIWQTTPTYMKLPKDTYIYGGQDFMLAKQHQRVTVIERQNGKWKALKPFDIEEASLLYFFSHGFLTYNDRELRVFVRHQGLWTPSVLQLPAGLLASSFAVFESFEHPLEMIDTLKKGIRLDALGMYHNVVVFRSLHLQGAKLYARLHLLHLNSRHEVSRRKVIDILIEDLDTYTFNPPEADGNTFVFGYRLENGKFRLRVLQHRGKIMDEVEKIKDQIEQDIRQHPDAPEEEKQRYRNESHEKLNGELEELYRNITAQIPFAIDPAKFGMIVNDAHIVAASHKLAYDGLEWTTNKIPQQELTMERVSIDLGSSYRLVKANRNATFELVGSTNVSSFDTGTDCATAIHIRYPSFMAVQLNDSAAELFNFRRDELTSLPDGELFDGNSNSLAVISSTVDGKNVFVRSMDSFGVTRQNVVWRHEFTDSRMRKLTNIYEFNAHTAIPYEAGFLMRDVKITPVSTPEARYGWFQVHYDFANSTRSTKSVYNSAGKLVKLVEPSAAESKKKLDSDGVLLARDGRTVVADFRPYRISNEVVAYYGFEPYEQNLLSAGGRWSSNRGVVRREHENHFLHLGPSTSINAIIQPKTKFTTLVVSCWLRGSVASQDVGDKLTVHYNGKTVRGTIGFTADSSWTYVEVLVENTEKFQLQISPGNDGFLDVDHLRVFPAELELKVHIYDRSLAIERSTLHASGLLSHRLHDAFGNEIGHIDQRGSIEQLSFSSRTKNTRLEMRPALGEMLQAAHGGNVYSGSLRYAPETFALRFRYGDVKRFGTVRIELASRVFRMEFDGEQLTLVAKSSTVKIPREGELVIYFSNTHYSIWIDAQLQIEHFASPAQFDRYEISSKSLQIWDVTLLYDVSVKVIYLTDFGKPKQILELKESNTIAIQEIVFDDLNRPAVKTKWTELDGANSSTLFAYRHNFVGNESQFWRTKRMEGMVTKLNADCEAAPYSRTVYADNPLEEKTVQSFPGKAFSVEGPFAKHYNSKQRIDFLENLFPRDGGFYYESERYPEQSIYVTVYNRRKLKVAEYVRTRQGDHHLTTFEYDTKDRLVLQLPPTYHEQANTFSRSTPFFGGTFSSEHMGLQRAWGTWYQYDRQSDLMTLKRTPDTGNTRYLYTPEGFLRFVLQENSTSVMYFTYSSVGKLSQRGIVQLDTGDLSKYLPNDASLPVSSNFLLLEHGNNDVAPLHRHRVENIRKISNDHILSELLLFDHQGQLITSALYSNTNVSLTIGYKYRKNQIHEIHYPVTVKGNSFRLKYGYDHRGKLISIAHATTGEQFVLMENNSLGLPKRMIVQSNTRHAYQRSFRYNQPGYLTKIEDPYLTETIDYAGTGYGGRPIGDGTVQATHFNATWHANSAAKHLKLKPSHMGSGRRSKFCFDALTAAGYIDAQGKPLKSLYPMLDLQLPIVCRKGTYGHQIAAVLNRQGFPERYGHRYDYGNHRQLIRAKYFQSTIEERYSPLRSQTLTEIDDISAEDAADIWNKLQEAGFLHSDCSTGAERDCHGLPGKSLFHPTIANHENAATLSSLMARVIGQRKDLRKNSFDQLCAEWFKNDFSDTIPRTCNAIWTMLSEAGFVGANYDAAVNAISPELRDLLSEYSSSLPKIVTLLYDKFATALGHSSADVQSFAIDANGNHRHFYTGFQRFRLEYVKNTNKLSAVYRTDFTSPSGLEETRFDIEHNDDGSVTRAMHKDIQRIVYDPLLNRATEIRLTDGRRLQFDYNSRGHRLYKYVYDRAGQLQRKKYYIRDVQGKPLVEYEAIYGDQKEVVRATVFLYADDRLVGFIRNDQFYSVTLDHEGSVRLVIKNGEIVAAYDYLPYGEMLRTFGTEDSDGHLDYRFTGKEWDKETNLYDFHARLYDPELGRFLQMDPKEQYASPYLYAGNSPVSLIDPDGQLAFLVVALVVGGAYLGAASANNSWNPTKWNLKKALIGGLIGGVIGGLAPASIAGSVTFLSGYIGTTAAIGVITATSAGFAYLSLSSANGSWDPSKWDWSKPGTWNALFVGSLTGASLFNAVGQVHQAFLSYTGITRTAFVVVASTSTAGFFLYSGSRANDGNFLFWEWDWSKPGTIRDLSIEIGSETSKYLAIRQIIVSCNYFTISNNQPNRSFVVSDDTVQLIVAHKPYQLLVLVDVARHSHIGRVIFYQVGHIHVNQNQPVCITDVVLFTYNLSITVPYLLEGPLGAHIVLVLHRPSIGHLDFVYTLQKLVILDVLDLLVLRLDDGTVTIMQHGEFLFVLFNTAEIPTIQFGNLIRTCTILQAIASESRVKLPMITVGINFVGLHISRRTPKSLCEMLTKHTNNLRNIPVVFF